MLEPKRSPRPARSPAGAQAGQARGAGVEPAALLVHAAWVRGLALQLAADADQADDLAQETLLVAVERRPAEGVPLRRWLARIARNLGASVHRRAGQRRARERTVARAEVEHGLDPSELLERLEAHRELVEAVHALEEPYRSTILMRYFEGLQPRAIARSRGVPVRTVHTQLSRGLCRLRAVLEREGRRPLSHCLALLTRAPDLPTTRLAPPAAEPAASGAALLGGLLLNAKTKLALGFALAAGVWFAVRGAEPVRPALEPALAGPAATSLGHDPRADDRLPVRTAPAAAPRSAVPDEPAAEQDPPAEPDQVSLEPLAGRVVDLEGRALAGVRVALASAAGESPADGEALPVEPVETAGDGSFAFQLETADPRRARGRFELADPRWKAVFTPAWPVPGEEAILVAAPRIRLEGRVVAAGGLPVADAELVLSVTSGARAGLELDLQRHVETSFAARSAVDGTFALDAVAVPVARLHTLAGGFEEDVRAAPQATDLALWIELEQTAARADRLAGTVVDELGAPVEEAEVTLGFQTARTGPDGAFVLRLPERTGARDALHGNEYRLAAIARGHLPAFLDCSAEDPRERTAWPAPLVLRLGGAPLALEGTLFGADGAPVAGAQVALLDATPFGTVRVPGEVEFSMHTSVEAYLAGEGPGATSATDERGRFALRGLLPRDYELRCVDPASATVARFGPFAAGSSGLRLALPRSPLRERVAGRVTSLDGQPLGGVHVRALVSPEGPGVVPEDGPAGFVHGPGVVTDADGRFEFRDLSALATHLSVSGLDIGFGHLAEIPSGPAAESIAVEVPRTCAFRIDVSERHPEAEVFELLDAAGTPLEVTYSDGTISYATVHGTLHAGRSQVLKASETAALARILLPTGPIDLAIRLHPGEVTEITP